MNRIAINEPCHENWAAMTPTQQGAFCGKCQIDVVDFSGKSATEVKLILQESVGKHLCGRFEKKQFDDLNATYVEWDNQSPKVFQSKFLYACLLVFGMTLFSCNTPEKMIVGEIYFENAPPVEQVDPTSFADNNVDQNASITEDNRTYIQDNPKYLKGKIAYNPPVTEQTNCAIESDTELFVKGEISVVQEPEYKMGQMMIMPDSLLTNKTTNEEPQTIITPISETGIIGDQFTAKIYPNPTGTISTISVTALTSGMYQVELFSLNGQKVLDVFSGELPAGENSYRIDLSLFETGTYLVKVSSNQQTETFRIIKAD